MEKLAVFPWKGRKQRKNKKNEKQRKKMEDKGE